MSNEPIRTTSPPNSSDTHSHAPDTQSQPIEGGTVVRSPADVARMIAAKDPTPVVPGYEILGELGHGAMGVVYKARQVSLNRLVALKVILSDRLGQNELVRFRAEAEAVAAIKHEHVVQVHDCGAVGGRPYMVLEYLPGGTLADVLATPNRPKDASAAREVAQLVGKIARGVAAAHARGIVHRDLKPANVLFDANHTPKVSDFGLAKWEGSDGLTADGAIMGTPAYMSPEQADGRAKSVGPPADVWALGVIFYEYLTGDRPFAAESAREMLARVLVSEPLPPRALAPAVPPDLERVCLKCLAKRPEDRYPTAKELADDLDRFLGGELVRAEPPESTGPVSRSLARWAVYVLAMIALLGTGVGIAALAGAFDRQPAGQPTRPEPPPDQTVRPAPVKAPVSLYLYTGSLVGWVPDGGAWGIEQDDEHIPVMEGAGTAVRKFDPPPHFRVVLYIDPYKASTVEVQVATTDGPQATATRWLVRLNRDTGAAFGKRVGMGAFEPIGSAVPLPTAKELEERGARPYFEVAYERTGGKLAAKFRGQPLGAIPDAGLQTTELRIEATGGRTRLDAAMLEEIVEQK